MGGRPAVASLNIRGKWAWFYDEGRFLLSVCTVYSLAFRSFGREGGREGVALRLGNVTPESNPTPTGLARFIPSARLACKSSRGAIKPETDRLTTNTTFQSRDPERESHFTWQLPLFKSSGRVACRTILLTVWN